MNKPLLVLVATTLAAGSASAYLWQELQTQRAQTERLQARIVELERGRANSPPPLNTANAAVAEPPIDAPQPLVAPPKAGGPPQVVAVASALGGPVNIDPEMRQRLQENFDQQQRLLKNPEYRELMRTQQKAGMRRFYSDMEPLLGLTKEEAEHVLDIIAEQQLRGMEQRPYLPVDGQPNQQALEEQRQFFERLQQKNEAELRAALGTKYSDWREYQQNGWARMQVNQLRDALAGSDEPLRPDQLKPLVQAFAREQKQAMNRAPQMSPALGFGQAPPTVDPVRQSEEWLQRTTETHERIRDAATNVLSPAQLEQLTAQQEQERKMQELQIKLNRAQAEARARGELPPAPDAAMGVAVPGVVYTEH